MCVYTQCVHPVHYRVNLLCIQLYKYFIGTLSLAHQGYTMAVNSVRVMVGLASPPLKVRTAVSLFYFKPQA